MTVKQKTILYVDDDTDDQVLLAEAIKTASPDMDVVLAGNGLEALSFLAEKKNKCENLPCLIVLDLNMPFLDGKETYLRLRSDSNLQNIPVIVFSSSERPGDKDLFNGFGIEYFTKPSNYSYMNQIVHHMIEVCC